MQHMIMTLMVSYEICFRYNTNENNGTQTSYNGFELSMQLWRGLTYSYSFIT